MIVFFVNLRQQIETAWLGILWSKVLHGLVVYVATSMHSLYGSLDLLRKIHCKVRIKFFMLVAT
jgi:hypothetical protein